MKVFYLQPITDDVLIEKLHHEIEGEIIDCDRISSAHKKQPYETKNELDLRYLEHARGIIDDVSDYIRGFLPRFFSSQRADFDYVRRYNVEFLKRHQLLITVRARTDKEDKQLPLSFDLPSFVYIPRMLCRIKGQDVYLHNHLKSSISFVIGNRENPRTDDYFIEDAMEELWHLAIHPYLIAKLNRNLRSRAIKPPDDKMSEILLEGESLAKAFALVSFDEFKDKKGYHIARVESKYKERTLIDKIKGIGIRGALKEIGRRGIFDFPSGCNYF